jgi:predicted nucleic-acid-binding protein
MRAVDTNVLVRIIARDDPRQTGAAEAFVADGAWLSHVVLAELAWVLESVYDSRPKGSPRSWACCSTTRR